MNFTKVYTSVFSFIFVMISCLGVAQLKEGLKIPPNPKIGLSLSGGGAKGFTHVGVLKVLDSLGVRVDYIAGTSMGSIVGGMYASGYSAKEIEQVIKDTDFFSLIANEKNREEKTFFDKSVDKYIVNAPIKDGKINVLPKAISNGQKNIYMLKEIFRNVNTVEDFSQLPIPFLCVGTNLETGKIKIFEKGDLVKSIMASSAFPGLLDPVKIGDSLYIDGAMTVNYPSEMLKEKGIDIVIGVDLSQGLSTREQLNSVAAIINQVIDFGIQKETQRQYNFTDINVHPNLDGLGATSYGEKMIILKKGWEEAQKYIDIFKQLPKRENPNLRAPSNYIFSTAYKIEELRLENNNIYTRDYIVGKMNLKLPAMLTYNQINSMMDKLYATDNFSLISYDILNESGKYVLSVHLDEDNTRYFLRAGLHYDQVFKTGLLLNATAKRVLFKNSSASLDVVIGDQPRYYFNYFIDNGYIPGFGLYASGMKFNPRDAEKNTRENWTWLRNEAYIQSIWKDKYALGGGISHDYFVVKETQNNTSVSNNSLNPYVFIKSDSRDDRDFSTKGLYLYAEGKLLDILGSYDKKRQIQVKADARISIPFGEIFSSRMRLAGGFSLGDTDHPFYRFHLGGWFDQNLGNFQPMFGYQFGQIRNRNFMLVAEDLQFKIMKNLFVTAHVSIANTYQNLDFEDVLKIQYSSVGLTAGYKSPVGQIKLNYSKALDKTPGIFSVVLGHWF